MIVSKISSENQKIKVIITVQPQKQDNLNIQQLKYFYDFRKIIKSDSILFIYLIIGNKKDYSNNQLLEIEKRFNIKFGFISNEQLYEVFKLKECKYGGIFIINKDNRIRLSLATLIDIETIKEIIERELYVSNK